MNANVVRQTSRCNTSWTTAQCTGDRMERGAWPTWTRTPGPGWHLPAWKYDNWHTKEEEEVNAEETESQDIQIISLRNENGEVVTLRRLQQWSHGVTLMDREELRTWENVGSENTTLKARQARSGWYGHMLRMDEGNKVKQTMNMEVTGTREKEEQEWGGWTTSGMTWTSEVWRKMPKTGEDGGVWYRAWTWHHSLTPEKTKKRQF